MQHDDNTARDVRSWPWRQAARQSPRAAPRSRSGAAHEGAAGLARHGPAGARRRLRPAGLCAQSRPGRQAPRSPTATRRGRSSARPNEWPTGRPRSRSSTSTAPSGQCAGQHLHSRRRMARQPRRRLRVPGRAVRQGGRALRHPRLHQCRRRRRQTCFPWSSRCGARSAGSIATPQAFGGDPEPALSVARIPPARTSAAAW